jgi:hypothetical protein
LDSVTDTIGWPIGDRGWIAKVLLMGLISLIPVYGWVVLTGWTLASLDNLRAGRREMAPVGLGLAYFGRGIRLFLVVLVYSVAIGLITGLLIGAGSALASTGNRTDNGFTSLAGVLLMIVGSSLVALGLVALYMSAPAIAVATERGGIGAGLNPGRVVGLIRSEPQQAIIAGLMTVIASVIGGLGGIACGIGSFLTIAYGQAVFAAAVHHLEQSLPEPDRRESGNGAGVEAPA